jgi:hypothetical protein
MYQALTFTQRNCLLSRSTFTDKIQSGAQKKGRKKVGRKKVGRRCRLSLVNNFKSYLLTKTLFTYSILEMIFSIVNLFVIFNQFRRNRENPESTTGSMENVASIVFSLNAFLMAFFFFIPLLSVPLLYEHVEKKFLVNLISLAIFSLFLPLHFVANTMVLPLVKKLNSRQGPVGIQMRLLQQ